MQHWEHKEDTELSVRESYPQRCMAELRHCHKEGDMGPGHRQRQALVEEANPKNKDTHIL